MTFVNSILAYVLEDSEQVRSGKYRFLEDSGKILDSESSFKILNEMEKNHENGRMT